MHSTKHFKKDVKNLQLINNDDFVVEIQQY